MSLLYGTFLRLYVDCRQHVVWRSTDGTGYFGAKCDRQCPQHCTGGRCHRIFGYCECMPGLFGAACNRPCPAGTWGPNCIHLCNCSSLQHATGCHPKDGRCKCEPGYQGDTCQHPCPPGYYGDQCRQVCGCAEGMICDAVNGDCIDNCSAGRTGARCDQRTDILVLTSFF